MFLYKLRIIIIKKIFREKVYKKFYILNLKIIDIWDKLGVI